jgi:hypothetical protein
MPSPHAKTQFVFTLDYEIYGNGTGSLASLVIEPTQRLAEVFQRNQARFVVFAEAVEFPKIETAQTDPGSAGVRRQLRELRSAGHEIALHLHPWWARARHEGGRWHLDWSERNICDLDAPRVDAIVSEAIGYLRDALEDQQFSPVSFRSGLWAMQPTASISTVLVKHGIRVDSSVFKGGRVQALGLDYRKARVLPGHWRFSENVLKQDARGELLELPIHSEMVPFWRMLGSKRLKIQKRVPETPAGTPLPRRWFDFCRVRYPRKFDFCRMTFQEMKEALDGVLHARRAGPTLPDYVVAIGHSKDLVDFEGIQEFLAYLRQRHVPVVTLVDAARQLETAW